MPTEEVITKYLCDITDFNAKFEAMENHMKVLDKAVVDTGEKSKTAFKGTGEEVDKLKEKTSGLSAKFEEIGKTLIAAFAVERVIEFGSKYVDEFGKAQKAALQLLGALNGNKEAQERLLKLAEGFSKRFAIDNDVLVSQQTFLAVQGRSEQQIKKTLEAAIQLSSVTGEDLNGSIRKLDATYEGNLGRLGRLDKGFNELSKTQLANGAAVDLVLAKYVGFAEKGVSGVEGALKRAEIEFEETAKRLGATAAPIKIFFAQAESDVLSGIEQFILAAKNLVDKNRSILNPANWFGANDAENIRQENLKFLEEQTAQAREAFENFTAEKLALIIKGNQRELKENKNLTEQQRAQLQGEYLAAADLLKVKKESAAADAAAVESLSSLKAKLEDLQSQQEKVKDPLGLGKGENTNLLAQITATQKKIDEITGKAQEERNKAALDADKTREQERLAALKELISKNEAAAKDANQIDLANLEIAKQNELGLEERSVQEKILIDIKYLELKKALYSDDKVEQSKIDAQIASAKRALGEQALKDRKDTDDALNKQSADAAAKELKIAQDLEKQKQQLIEQSLQYAGQIADQLFQLGRSLRDAQIMDLEAQQQAQTDSFDKEDEELNNRHKKKLLSDRDFETQSAKIKEQRVAAEKKVAQEIAELKRKQAIVDKEQAIFNIILNTSEAIIKAAAQTGIFAEVFIPVIAALGALQLANVVAQPIPKFARGTKGKTSTGLGLVGEEGPELMFMPAGVKVLPAAATKTFGDAIDAMYDNRFDKYVFDNFVAPALTRQKAIYEKNQQDSFANNISNSISMQGGIDEYGMKRVFGDGIKITNVKQLAEAIAASSNGRYSAYQN